MTDDKNAAEPHEGDEAAESAEESASQAADEFVEAEGPDVEVSSEQGAPFTDEDLAFLAGETPAESTTAADQESELLTDLKRVQAEFVNYRKRVDRDRETGRELAIAEVVKSLLPVLDDLDRAEAHGDLSDGPMVVIAQKLRGSLEKFGLTSVGEKGDVFDPHLHEALVQLPTADVTVNTVADVVARGYLLGERLLRPAKVAVSVPAE
jgi:molecular chaperone GrpE